MEVSFQPHAPAALPLGKNLLNFLRSPPYPFTKRLIDSPQPVWTFCRREKYFALPEFQILPTRRIKIYLALSKLSDYSDYYASWRIGI
jgi:hypothetical protein